MGVSDKKESGKTQNRLFGLTHNSQMALGPAPSAIHISKVSLGVQNSPANRTPSQVTIHPSALFTILDHYLRRKDAQERVIGTLLGVRTEENGGTIEVRTAFAVLHSETDEQVAVDMEYHQTMYELHRKVNPREAIVGWCVQKFQNCLLFLYSYQVLYWIKSQYLFCPNSKFLRTRNKPSSSDTCGTQHRSRSFLPRGQSIHQFTSWSEPETRKLRLFACSL